MATLATLFILFFFAMCAVAVFVMATFALKIGIKLVLLPLKLIFLPILAIGLIIKLAVLLAVGAVVAAIVIPILIVVAIVLAIFVGPFLLISSLT